MKKLWLTATVLLTVMARAQDSRTVTEPQMPPACNGLLAQLVAGPDGLDPADEQKLDTARIQAAIDSCGQGRGVRLMKSNAHNAFLTGPLQLRKGVTLIVDKGVTLYGSRDPRVYDVRPGSCGRVGDEGEKSGCRALIYAKRAKNSGIMGDGAIDGRGGAKLLLVTPSGSADGPESWWDLAEDARKGGKQMVPRMIDTDYTDDFTAYRITLKNSPNFHLAFHHGNGLTVWGIKIDTPKTARNTDGIDPSRSKNITITESFIRSGDDNVAIKASNGGTKNVSVVHNHFYWGHGMSIGSETDGGITGVFVSDLSLDGPDNGIRIKSNPSRGGLVREVIYDNVCIRNSKAPLILDTAYNKPGDTHSREPVYRDIVLHNVRISGGGKVQLLGLDESHRIGIQFDGVILADPNAKYKFMARHSDIVLGPGPVNFQLTGEDSTVRGQLVSRELPSCAAMFVPFPGSSSVPGISSEGTALATTAPVKPKP